MTFSPTAVELEEIVSSFECAAQTGHAELVDFLPPAESSLYALALRELIRVDMELQWTAGRPRRVEDYLSHFPSLRDDAVSMSEICFEEYRLRQSRGERPDPAAYSKLFHVDTKQWPIEQATDDAIVQCATEYLKDSTVLTSRAATANGPSDSPTRLFFELHEVDRQAAHNLAEALTSFPSIGDSFMGFDLIDELGRGAFSRVYLAQERAVDGRRVALKITGDVRSEVRALARLRHTNIAPVYSVKTSGPFHAVCMPYCGTITLAHLIRKLFEDRQTPKYGRAMTRIIGRPTQPSTTPLLQKIESQSFVDAVLGLSTRLAEGLAHAHDRGICHRDIKPANVLMADDGEPLLLDFNLATEMRACGSPIAALIGGTLPYMAPEQLRAFRNTGPSASFASDVYSFGLMLFEWLTGQLPNEIESGDIDAIIDRLINERSKGLFNVRQRNSDVSPSFAAIIGKCLQTNPELRYPTAREMAEDLARQRDNQTLRFAKEPSLRECARKWSKRHPRLSSGTMITAISVCVIFGVSAGAWSLHRDRAVLAERENRRQFFDEFQVAKMALAHPDPSPDTMRRGMAAASKAWQRFPESSSELNSERGKLALLLAYTVGRQAELTPNRGSNGQEQALQWNRRAQMLLGTESIIAKQQADWLAQMSSGRVAPHDAPEMSSTNDLEAGLWLLSRKHSRRALSHLVAATRIDPDSVQAWWLRGLAEQSLGMFNAAYSSYTTCLALDRQLPDTFHSRAAVAMALGQYRDALEDLQSTIGLDAESKNAIVDRAICKLELNDLVGAEADITIAIDSGYPETRLYFLRSRIRERLGKVQESKLDRDQGMEREPFSEADWSARALARLPEQPKAALMDLDQCLQNFPKSVLVWQNRAYVFDEFMHDTDRAINALDEAIRLDPDNGVLWAGRGVLLARRREHAAARNDATKAIGCVGIRSYANKLDERPEVLYQVAGIYALTAKDRPSDLDKCLFLLDRALQLGYGIDLVEIDPELKSVRNLPEIRRMITTAKTWKNAENFGGSEP